MSITIEIDDAKLQEMQPYLQGMDPRAFVQELVRRQLRAYEAQQRLAAAGGTMPDLMIPPRERPPEF
jgi:Arc/MetJ family transcription regulator